MLHENIYKKYISLHYLTLRALMFMLRVYLYCVCLSSSPAYEPCRGPMVQHYCHGATSFTHPIAVRTLFNLVFQMVLKWVFNLRVCQGVSQRAIY